MKEVLAASLLAATVGGAAATAAFEPLPSSLHATGLYAAASGHAPAGGVETFTPQYPLWSDGASKRRWIRLPAGGAIDAAQPGGWDFPTGTKFWKEFSVDGRRIETRTIERLEDGSWRFAAYVWNADESDALLAPTEGTRVRLPDGSSYAVPGIADCRACHEGGAAPVLGFNALQLSPARDPLAPHAESPLAGDLDLQTLEASGRLVGLPAALRAAPPRIEAPTPAGRAALGYLAANCGHCHADPKLSPGAVPVALQLQIDATDGGAGTRTIQTLIESASRYRPAGAADDRLVVPGDSRRGTLLARMRSRDPRIQMPPLGSARPDQAAIELIERWIDQDLKDIREQRP